MDTRTWHRFDPTTKQTYLVSTRREYMSEDFINEAFATSDMHWAKPLPPAALKTMLDNCLAFGLYVTTPPLGPDSKPDPSAVYSELKQIGMARIITDRVTFAYFTDVYVQPNYRSKGLAVWMIKCCREILDGMRQAEGEGFRNSLLLTSNFDWAIPTYERILDMHVPNQDRSGPVVMSTKFKKH